MTAFCVAGAASTPVRLALVCELRGFEIGRVQSPLTAGCPPGDANPLEGSFVVSLPTSPPSGPRLSATGALTLRARSILVQLRIPLLCVIPATPIALLGDLEPRTGRPALPGTRITYVIQPPGSPNSLARHVGQDPASSHLFAYARSKRNRPAIPVW